MVGVDDLGPPVATDGRPHGRDTALGVQGDRDPPGQQLSADPVHHRHQIDKDTGHGNIGIYVISIVQT